VLKEPFLCETLAHKLRERHQLPIKICIYVKSNALLIIDKTQCQRSVFNNAGQLCPKQVHILSKCSNNYYTYQLDLQNKLLY
jgi:hypothetical protein